MRQDLEDWLVDRWRGLALALTVFALAVWAGPAVVGLAWDDGLYHVAGESLADHTGFQLPNRVGDQSVPTIPPGYPLLIGVVHRLITSEIAVLQLFRIFSAACVGLAVYVWWRLLRDEHGPVLALVGAAVPALSYGTLAVGSTQMTDAPLALLVALTGRLARADRPATWRVMTLIVLGTVALQMRSAAIALVGAIAIVLWRRRGLAWGAAAVAVALAVTAVLRLRYPGGDDDYITYIARAYGEGGLGWRIQRDAVLTGLHAALTGFVLPPLVFSGRLTALASASVPGVIVLRLALWCVTALISFGLWRRARREGRGWGVLEWALVLTVALLLVFPFTFQPRYLQPFAPAIVLAALAGAEAFGKRAAAAAGAALVVVALLTGLQGLRFAARNDEVWEQRAADYLAAARDARGQLGDEGILVAEFSELLWIHARLRSAPAITIWQNVRPLEEVVAETEARLARYTRGCTLDAGVYPLARLLADRFAARPGSEERVAAPVRVVCWGGVR